jgi:hypothetical protein
MEIADVLRWRISRHFLGAERYLGAYGPADATEFGLKAAASLPQERISPTLMVNGRIEGVWEPSADGPRLSPGRQGQRGGTAGASARCGHRLTSEDLSRFALGSVEAR